MFTFKRNCLFNTKPFCSCSTAFVQEFPRQREQLCTRALLSAPEASEKPRSCPVASDWKTASTPFVCGTAARAPSQLVLFSSSRFCPRGITTLDVEVGSFQARSCVYMGTLNTDEVIVWIQSAQRRFPCFLPIGTHGIHLELRAWRF